MYVLPIYYLNIPINYKYLLHNTHNSILIKILITILFMLFHNIVIKKKILIFAVIITMN